LLLLRERRSSTGSLGRALGLFEVAGLALGDVAVVTAHEPGEAIGPDH
jgi:hypothetical protein